MGYSDVQAQQRADQNRSWISHHPPPDLVHLLIWGDLGVLCAVRFVFSRLGVDGGGNFE